MNFEEWFKENSDYSIICDACLEAERAWNHQQAKIDAALDEIESALRCVKSTETECVLLQIKELLK